MRVKYVHQRVRASGQPYWAFIPTEKVKKVTGCTFKAFDDLEEARTHSDKIVAAYEAGRRKLHGQVSIQPDTIDDLFQRDERARGFREDNLIHQRNIGVLCHPQHDRNLPISLAVGSGTNTFRSKFQRGGNVVTTDACRLSALFRVVWFKHKLLFTPISSDVQKVV